MITRNNPSLLNCCPIPFLLSLSHSPLPFLPFTLLLFPLLFLLLPLPLPFTNLLTSRSPPSLSLLAKLFTPLRYSATFEPSKKAPLHLPRYLSFIALQQMISEDRLYPLAVGASKLSRHYRALLFGRSHIELDITGSHYQFFQRFSLYFSWTFLFPLSTNLGNFFLLILMLRTRTSLNNTLRLPRTCPRSCSTPPSNPPCYITGAKDIGLPTGTGPSPSNLSDQTPPPCSSQSIIRTPHIVLPYLCEPFLSYHGTSRNPLAQIFHLLHIVTSLDL